MLWFSVKLFKGGRATTQKVTVGVIVEVFAQAVGGGDADKRSSSPDTWPTFTAASHVTVLLREKDPFVSQCREEGREGGREGGLGGEPPLGSTTPPAIKKKQGPDFPPLPGVLSAHSRSSTQTQAHQ
ncbi:hypothetical protein EYF80_061180 [Liparis tanakae]|uniref:Uncharacterized protein n=1 Tax=Liparis tanakae TaxID=230148 RepID=A0A4Z2EJ69_9TELE|nr:hypothetical protein EYF80_061180 [Liparis tanakae]